MRRLIFMMCGMIGLNIPINSFAAVTAINSSADAVIQKYIGSHSVASKNLRDIQQAALQTLQPLRELSEDEINQLLQMIQPTQVTLPTIENHHHIHSK